jgi:sigma-E factor negative regulatory protein RseB
LAGCVVRGLEDGAQDPSMLQAVFSDGLTHVSVFVERYDAERHRSEMRAKLGATNTRMRRLGEYWITVVGDVPPAALNEFSEALERRR